MSWLCYNLGSEPIDSHHVGSMSAHPLEFFFNFTFKIYGQSHSLRSHIRYNIQPIPEIQHFPNLTLKIQGQSKMTIMLHNYRARQFHRNLKGLNPSSGFRDIGSAKSCPSAAWFGKFLAHRRAHVGQKGKSLWRCTTTVLDKSSKL